MKRTLLLVLISFSPLICINAQNWHASPEVVDAGAGGEKISGVVFEDANRNGLFDEVNPALKV